MASRQTTSFHKELVPAPPIHDLVLPQESMFKQYDSSDYGTGTSRSFTSVDNEVVISRERVRRGDTAVSKIKRAIRIKPRYIPSKLCYYFFYGSRSVLATYFIIFLTSTGLNPEQVGLIQGIRMFVLTSGGIFWGILADKSKRCLPILLVQTISYTALLFSKPWIAYWINVGESATEHRLHVMKAVNETLSASGNFTLMNSTEFTRRTNTQLSKKFGLDWSTTHYKTGSMPLFVSMLCLGVGSAFFGGGIRIMLDSKVMDFCSKTSTSKCTYGRQRLWGSVAYSITPVICGAILETVPTSGISPYMPVFYIHLALISMSILSFVILFKQQDKSTAKPVISLHSTDAQAESKDEESVFKFLYKTFKNVHMFIFLINLLWIGCGNSLQWSFQFIYMEEMNASKTLMGLSAMTQCGTEAIVFPLASKLTNKIGGNRVAMTIAIIGHGLLFTCFSLIRNPIWMPLVTCIVGFTYTMFHIAANDTMYKISNPRCLTTLYATYNGILVGLAGVLSGVIGGSLYKHIGGRSLFMMNGILFLLVGIINIAYSIIYKRLPDTNTRQCKKTYTKFMDIYIESEPADKESSTATVKKQCSATIVINESNVVENDVKC